MQVDKKQRIGDHETLSDSYRDAYRSANNKLLDLEKTSIETQIIFTEAMMEYSKKTSMQWSMQKDVLIQLKGALELMSSAKTLESKLKEDTEDFDAGYKTQEDTDETETEAEDDGADENTEEEDWSATRCPKCGHEGPAQCDCAMKDDSESPSLKIDPTVKLAAQLVKAIRSDENGNFEKPHLCFSPLPGLCNYCIGKAKEGVVVAKMICIKDGDDLRTQVDAMERLIRKQTKTPPPSPPSPTLVKG